MFDLIDGIGVGAGGMEDSVRIQALTDYLRLSPGSSLVSNLWNDQATWVESLPHAQFGVCRLEAMFLERTDRVRNPERALRAADDWVDADPLNPEAHLCRMRCQTRRDVDAVANDASIAWQSAVDRDAMRARIVEVLRREEAFNPGLEGVRQAFERGG